MRFIQIYLSYLLLGSTLAAAAVSKKYDPYGSAPDCKPGSANCDTRSHPPPKKVCKRELFARDYDHDTFMNLIGAGPDTPKSIANREAALSKRVVPLECRGAPQSVAKCKLDYLKKHYGCNWTNCVIAMSACISACGAAAAQGLIDWIADMACLAAIGVTTNDCNGCDAKSVS